MSCRRTIINLSTGSWDWTQLCFANRDINVGGGMGDTVFICMISPVTMSGWQPVPTAIYWNYIQMDEFDLQAFFAVFFWGTQSLTVHFWLIKNENAVCESTPERAVNSCLLTCLLYLSVCYASTIQDFHIRFSLFSHGTVSLESVIHLTVCWGKTLQQIVAPCHIYLS